LGGIDTVTADAVSYFNIRLFRSS